MAAHPKRFYKTVEIAALGAQGAHRVLLDGKTLRTPAGTELLLPNRSLAEAVSEEWRVQGVQIIFARMPLTRLAFTAIDKVGKDRDAAIGQIVAFGKSDVVCYRAAAPLDLVERQRKEWDPLLRWATDDLGVTLQPVEGVEFVEQPTASLAKIRALVSGLDYCKIAAVQAAAELCGSAVIALALLRGVLGSEAAFVAANLDELYQAEKWGDDPEAKARRDGRAKNLEEIAQFLRLTDEI